MGTWVNNDGLVVRTGTDEAKFTKAAGYRNDGPSRVTKVILRASDLMKEDSAAAVVEYAIRLPKGAQIEHIEVGHSTVEFAGAGTVDIGVKGKTVNAPSAILDGVAAAALNTPGATDVDYKVTEIVNLVITRTGALTAGVVQLELFWSVPVDAGDTLVYAKA